MIDEQNKNPSRLSRMPGVMRNENKQYLIDTNIGKESWNKWSEWIESINDDLPDPEALSSVWDSPPELAPELIEGVLRCGHKMLISGPSKAGKSFALIELSIALAEGAKWFEWQCRQGKVLYVNLELDRASCFHRFKDVYKAMGLQPKHINDIDIWNLRGKSVPMDKLAPKLIRRAMKKKYAAVIIDPIYKVITGDENSADQMANFCNQFDKICTELGSAVIYCHHHSKGAQGGKRSMDRASGSGVFARDPDALIDLIELEITTPIREQEENKAVCNYCLMWLRRYDLEDEIPIDNQFSSKKMLEHCRSILRGQYSQIVEELKDVREAARKKTAWRIEGTLREFASFEPKNLWFNYPIHILDNSGVLKDINPEEAKAPWQKASEKAKKKAEQKRNQHKIEIDNFIDLENFGDSVTVRDLSKRFDKPESTVRDWIKKAGYTIENGYVKRDGDTPRNP